MEYKKVNNNYVVRIDKGEEVVEKIKKICINKNIKLGSVTGIGATNHVEIGLFNTMTKEYYPSTLKGLYEITSIMGNITTMNNEVYLHLHINVADEENKTYGGHLNKCIVSATVELIINVIDDEVNREFSDEIGLNLMEFNDAN